MPPIDTSALAAIFTWVWSQYGKTIVDKAGKSAWERLRWEDRALAYGQKVQRLYGTMQILGQEKPVPLEGIYTTVSLLDRPTAWHRYSLEELEAEFTNLENRSFYTTHDEKKRRNGLEMVRSGDNLFILGKPGAGKTTFLKHIALRGVAGDLGRVPIFVGLKQLADSGLVVLDFIVRQFDVCDFPNAVAYLDRLLTTGRAVLLFDGLDEVNVADDERARLIDDLESFTSKYDQCQRLITCRLAANEYSFQGYTYVEMADFNEVQIREFVEKWFSDDEQRRELFLSELQQAESEGLRELARVPLLLALLCLGFEETLKLSSRRVELYEEALDALLKKWDSSRNIRRDEVYRALSPKRKVQMLAQVAAETFDRTEYFIPKKTLVRSFETFLSRLPDAPLEADGEAVLRAIIDQHGLFLERAHGIYSFAHLTFQEYFTARYVVENEARGTVPRLLAHYSEHRYREVFVLTAAQLPDAAAFFDVFVKRLAFDALERPAVADLLRYVARKTSTVTAETLDVAARNSYICLALTRAVALSFDRTFKPLDRNYALAIYLELDRTFALTLDVGADLHHFIDRRLIHDLANTLTHDLTRDRTLALALDPNCDPNPLRDHVSDLACVLESSSTYDLAYSHLPRLARDIAVASAWLILSFLSNWPVNELPPRWVSLANELIASAITLSQRLHDPTFEQSLIDLASGFAGSETSINLQHLAPLTIKLRAILDEFDLNFPRLAKDDLQFITGYLDGNLRLLTCLDQAIVADRESIKERLLLLPPER